jgi:hypothetical protein
VLLPERYLQREEDGRVPWPFSDLLFTFDAAGACNVVVDCALLASVKMAMCALREPFSDPDWLFELEA